MTVTIAEVDFSELHQLRQSVAAWAAHYCDSTARRDPVNIQQRPPFWSTLAELGWLGLAVEERFGGAGRGLPEQAVVLEELGAALLPGPLLPSQWLTALVQRWGSEEQRARWLPGLVDGSLIGAVALEDQPELCATRHGDTVRLEGGIAAVLGAQHADVIAAPARLCGDNPAKDRVAWYLVEAARTDVSPFVGTDLTRVAASLRFAATVSAGARIAVPDVDAARALGARLAAAEALGGARWCVRTATEYAKVRTQFGRPVGQFQAVKHRCANMLALVEQATAAVWDAGRTTGDDDEAHLSAAIGAAASLRAFYACATGCIQVLGGIGFTWDHDAHLYLKRAMSLLAVFGWPSDWYGRVGRLALAGARRDTSLTLPAEAEAVRSTVRAFAEAVAEDDEPTRRERLAAEGYVMPHWPPPWGRGSSPLEQLLIDEEFESAGIVRPAITIGAWVLPTLIAHGSQRQQERWIRPTLRGEVQWCQLFSEPGAGSDLAALATRAERVDGGWRLTGQKIWTSMTGTARFGLGLARTSPLGERKHDGITCFIVDMSSAGLDIRPLRELTGNTHFSQVFLDAVFVPDDCVVGEPGDGWRVARSTLTNERVSMGRLASHTRDMEAIITVAQATGRSDDAAVVAQLGHLYVNASALSLMGLRATEQALAGLSAGSAASVQKLLGAEHQQAVDETVLQLLGPALMDMSGQRKWIEQYLFDRCLTIAGGTSEIQRNVIAERILGLPRDP